MLTIITKQELVTCIIRQNFIVWFNDCSLGKLSQIPKDLLYERVKINANNSY